MVEYDAELIQKFANRLYTQARTIIFVYMLIGAVGGSAVGYFVGMYLQNSSPMPTVSGALLVSLLAAISSYEKALLLKMKAQLSLCLMRIEKNTQDTSSRSVAQTAPTQ